MGIIPGAGSPVQSNGHISWKNPDGGRCEFCDHTTWCQVSDDGTMAMCRRQPDGAFKSGTDVNGAVYYLHWLIPPPDDGIEPVTVARPSEAPALADVETRHAVYTAMLNRLDLSTQHLSDLVKRGLDPDEITRRKYRTLAAKRHVGLAAELVREFGASKLLHVPGFFVNPKSLLSISALPGLLVPVRDAEHRIVALKVRPDKPIDSGNKYLWLSSKSKKGPGPGAPPHVPLGIDALIRTWRLTEGELKADIAASLSGVPTISASGVSNWKPCIPVLEAMGCRTVKLAYDADAWEKAEVLSALKSCHEGLKAAGFSVEIERWDPADGKGIDDVLAAGGTTEVLVADDADRAISEAEARILSVAGDRPQEATREATAEDLDRKLARYELTDLGNAERLIARHGRDLRYCHPWSRWLSWDGRRWALDRIASARYRARRTVRAMYAEAAIEESEDRRRDLAKHARTSEDARRIAALLKLAEAEEGVPILPDQMNSDPWLFNCLNGTIDLRTGELRPHRREDGITQLCPFGYDPDARCPLWEATVERFLRRDDPAAMAELVSYVQRLFGYAMVGVVRDHVLPVAYGTGSNGKSTLLGALMDVFGPDYAMKCPPDMLMAKKTDSHPTDRADLFGKRLVVAIETEAGRRLNETMVKELTGGDAIRARRMREDFWEFKPTHTLIMATNHKPAIRGTDNGIWRRLKLIPFTVSIDDQHADKSMPEKLRAEYPGILAWGVRGCLEWQRHGLEPPSEVREATKSYRLEQDLLGAFLDEHTVTGPSLRVKASALYGRYKAWAEAGSEFVATQTAFGLELQERGFTKRTSNGTWYLGLGLRETSVSEVDGQPY